MDAVFSTMIGKLLGMGGGWVLGAVMLFLYVLERRETTKLQDTVINMAKTQTEAAVKTESVLTGMSELVKEIARSMR